MFAWRALAVAPGARRAISRADAWRRRRRDGALVRARHPAAEIVNYSDAEVAGFCRSGFFSQHGQDHYLDRRVFPERTNGVFVEIGCAHPILGSNSRFFEERGWRGYSIDAQDVFAAEWRRERSTPFIHAAVSDRDGRRSFVRFTRSEGWEYNLAGFADAVLPKDLAKLEHETIEVDCRRLSTLLPDLDAMDLLMIDAEGAEREVLRGIDLERLAPRCVLVENNRAPGGDEALRGDLLARGYRLAARINAVDDVFLKDGGEA